MTEMLRPGRARERKLTVRLDGVPLAAGAVDALTGIALRQGTPKPGETSGSCPPGGGTSAGQTRPSPISNETAKASSTSASTKNGMRRVSITGRLPLCASLSAHDTAEGALLKHRLGVGRRPPSGRGCRGKRRPTVMAGAGGGVRAMARGGFGPVPCPLPVPGHAWSGFARGFHAGRFGMRCPSKPGHLSRRGTPRAATQRMR